MNFPDLFRTLAEGVIIGKSTMIQVMAWCSLAKSHYLYQWWLWFTMMLIGLYGLISIVIMITSSNGNIFCVVGPFVRGNHQSLVDSPHKGQWRRDFFVFFDLCQNKRLSKQLSCQWFEMLSRSLWCHCNDKTFLLTAGSLPMIICYLKCCNCLMFYSDRNWIIIGSSEMFLFSYVYDIPNKIWYTFSKFPI